MKKVLSWLVTTFLSLIVIFVILPVALVVTLSLLPVLFGGGGERGDNRVAVVELEGIITSSKKTIEELYRQVDNKEIKGIILRIDSPGGAVAPSQEIFTAVRKLKEKKPIIASFGAVAASGGLYAALGATRIYAQPGTLTGSIGVILQIPNVRKITDQFGFEMVTIKSGALKDAGNVFREMLEGEKAYLQSTVDQAHSGFVRAVVEGRGIPREEVLRFADGRVLLGEEALKLKLIDEIGDLDDAARRVFQELKTPLAPEERPELIYPDDTFRELTDLLRSVSSIGELFRSRHMELQYIMH